MKYVAAVILSMAFSIHSFAENVCAYKDATGTVRLVRGERNIPQQFRGSHECISEKEFQEMQKKAASSGNQMAAPQEVSLEGLIRKVQMVSPLGNVHLRWARSAEKLFGRTPERAVVDAMNTVSKTIKNNSFSSQLSSLQATWEIVFMDEEVPESQIPRELISNCHPAWMTPPSNIYVVAQRVAAGCGDKKVSTQEADRALTQVLLHEMGHVVEYYLLNQMPMRDRVRAEGFATWFEQLSGEYSSLLPKGSVKAFYKKAALLAYQRDPDFSHFDGSLYAYAKASLLFRAVEERRGVAGIRDLYAILSQGTPLFPALLQSTRWTQTQLSKEVQRVLQP